VQKVIDTQIAPVVGLFYWLSSAQVNVAVVRCGLCTTQSII